MIELFKTAQQAAERKRSAFAPALSVSDSESRLGLRYLGQQFASMSPLIFSDVVAAILVATSTSLLANLLGWSFGFSWFALTCYLLITTTASHMILGLYPSLGLHAAVELKRLIVSNTIICLCLTATWNWGDLHWTDPITLICLWTFLSIVIPTLRSICRHTSARIFKFTLQPIVIIGGGPMGEAIFRSLQARPACGFKPIGIVDDAHEQWTHVDRRPDWYIGTYPELKDIASKHHVYWAVVTDSSALDENRDGPEESRISPVEIPHRLFLAETASFVPTMWDQVVTLNMVPYFKQTDRLLLPLPRLAKRISDYLICLMLAIVILPIGAFVTLAIKLTSSGPIFFRSKRIGRGNRVFHMFKFRSMYTDAELLLEQQLNDCEESKNEWKSSKKLKRDPRITPIGRLLRRTSLDELPQILDVLRGKMSLVGPRPMLVSEPDMYGPDYLLYCRMRPGITGLWQVSGRNNTSHEQRVQLVSYYVQNWSPWLDLYILAKTFKVVTTGEGAY